MEYLLGLDPGGNGNFGWCVVHDTSELPRSAVLSGLSNDADSAISAALAAIPADGHIRAVGIDAPLFWSRSGSRNADLTVRAAIRAAGAPHAAGTVQDVNSLRGACLVQGMLAGLKLRELHPNLPITEAHPKALRWLLPEVADITASSEHERDALLSAVSAWAAARKLSDWLDLLPRECNPYTPLAQPLHYFMPGVPYNSSFKPTPLRGAA